MYKNNVFTVSSSSLNSSPSVTALLHSSSGWGSMANYPDKVHREQRTTAATCRLELFQMTNAHGAVLPGLWLCFPLCRLAPHLSVAASTWGATVVFTNLPKIAACLGLLHAASSGEEHLFWAAGVTTMHSDSECWLDSGLIIPVIFWILGIHCVV